MRPSNISNQDLSRWDEVLKQDPLLEDNILLKEVCYAGQYLAEKLTELKCSEDLIVRIVYTAGSLSFGRDPWEVHLEILSAYLDNSLKYQD